MNDAYRSVITELDKVSDFVRRSRRSQGFPDKVENDAVVESVARIMTPSDLTSWAARREAKVKRAARTAELAIERLEALRSAADADVPYVDSPLSVAISHVLCGFPAGIGIRELRSTLRSRGLPFAEADGDVGKTLAYMSLRGSAIRIRRGVYAPPSEEGADR